MTITDDCPYNLVAYHAQQCAEKQIKAYLVCCGIDFPYTHNIAYLLELCAGTTDWSDRLRDAEELTPYSVTARYPGEDEPVVQSEAKRAIEIAVQVCDVVCKALIDKGVS
ncbi:MAG: HEPN domain-containing protein [Planctomycetes bacterium]|nr:HEPN domain-containing protein [Planctomycetota bacterium]